MFCFVFKFNVNYYSTIIYYMVKKIEIGHTNESYRDGDAFLQYKNKNGLNHLSDYKEISKLDFVPKLISDDDKVIKWDWIDGEHLSNPNSKQLKLLAKTLLKLHHSNIKLAKFNVKNRVVEYRKIMRQKGIKIDVIENLYRKINMILKNMDKSKPVHGDLYQTNMLLTKDEKLFFIDWEYSHMGDIHYELAYIIEAYQFNEEQEKIFLDEYDEYDPYILKKHKVLVNYLTVLWLYAQEKLPFSPEHLIKKLEVFLKEGF